MQQMENKICFILVIFSSLLFLSFIKVRVTSQRNSASRNNNWHGHYFEASGGSYGDYCNAQQNMNCDNKAFLVCRNYVCSCIQQDQMIFDVAKGQCVGKAGAKCIYGHDELNPLAITIANTNPNQVLRPGKIPCVQNGICGNDGICDCLPGFYNSFNVTCLAQKVFDRSCHFDFECRADYHLRCIVGVCQCDPAVSVKHNTYDICLGLAGEKAIEGNCIEFSGRIKGIGKENVVCECLEGYTKGSDKKCHGGINLQCTIESPCEDSLSCVQGTCKCPYPDYQIYNQNSPTKNCLSMAYGPCNSSLDCVPGSFCNTSGLYNKCDCDPGFIIGVSRYCEKSFGTSCRVSRRSDIRLVSASATHNGNGKLDLVIDECSSSSLLQCRDGKCACADLKRFSEEDEKCVGLVGSICFKSDPSPICVHNAECMYQHERLGFGLCSCAPGFESNHDRECTAMRNTSEVTLPTTEATSPHPHEGDENENAIDILTEGSITSISSTTPTLDAAQIAQMNKNMLEFYKFLNHTLYGGFDNASFTRFMNENFHLPD